jgi:hypothetical protein
VLVAVEPRLLGDSLSMALGRTGEWDILQLHRPGRLPAKTVDAVIITAGLASVVPSDIVIALPDESRPGREGFVEIHGHRHRANLPTISAIVDALRRAEEDRESDADGDTGAGAGVVD